MILSGIVLLGMAGQELSGRGIDAGTVGTWKSGTGATAPRPETSHWAIGTVLAPVALGVVAVGVAGLLTKRRGR